MEALLLLLLVCSPWRLHVSQVDAKTFDQLAGGQSLSNFTSTLHGVHGLGDCVLICEMTESCSGGRYTEAKGECRVNEGAPVEVQDVSLPHGIVDFINCGEAFLVIKDWGIAGYNRKTKLGIISLSVCIAECQKYSWCISADYGPPMKCLLQEVDRSSVPASAFEKDDGWIYFEKNRC